MRHQSEWIADESDLKICEKGRRTGITFAEAAGLHADRGRPAISRRPERLLHRRHQAQGSRVHRLRCPLREDRRQGDADDRGRYLLRPEGRRHHAGDFQLYHSVRSGFRIEALSSRPENIRGLQGTVVIDEAAFHRDVRDVLDAVNALLIWGGKIRIISSHNGHSSPFNELIKEANAKKNPFHVHTYSFGDAVKNGLYKRVCLIKGEEWTQEKEDAWEAQIRASYGTRTAKMKQELDAIPAEAEGGR
jgi:phage FluMu gp28-like protein